ncbi:MAG: flavin reductase family protein [Atopobiaceae bacterium]|jgi:flavin reductase (DIM6/NTAB) family NADH-FMN oxidoreductase RutF
MDATALFTFPSGLYVVSAEHEDDWGACLINTGLQVTSEPIQVEVVVNKENHTESVIEKAGHFALCPITTEADMPYVGRFGFRTSTEFDKFGGLEKRYTSLGDPYTPACSAAVITCKVVQTLDVGTHVIFVGEVVDAERISSAEPMTYSYYHSTLKGKTPPKASSFVPSA